MRKANDQKSRFVSTECQTSSLTFMIFPDFSMDIPRFQKTGWPETSRECFGKISCPHHNYGLGDETSRQFPKKVKTSVLLSTLWNPALHSFKKNWNIELPTRGPGFWQSPYVEHILNINVYNII